MLLFEDDIENTAVHAHHASKRVASHLQESIWQSFLRFTVQSAVSIVAAEVWLTRSSTEVVELERPPGGLFIDNSFIPPANDAKRFLMEATRPVRPGVGIAGTHWSKHSDEYSAECCSSKSENGASSLSEPGSDELVIEAKQNKPAAASTPTEAAFGARLEWRSLVAGELGAAAQQHSSCAAAMFGQVASLSFGSSAQGGVLVLYARASAVSRLLHAPHNTAFLSSSAFLAGELLHTARLQQSLLLSKQEEEKGWTHLRDLKRMGVLVQSLRTRVLVGHEISTTRALLPEVVGPSLVAIILAPKSQIGRRGGVAYLWVRAYLARFKGSVGASAPAIECTRIAWLHHAVCWVGVFVSLLCVSAFNELIVDLSDETRIALIGSLGALVTLLYSAPASPLVQPRNVFGGNLVSASVAILFYYASGPQFANAIPKWLAVAIVPATSIAAMQVLGLSHPPAGAASLIFISGSAKITEMGWMYLVTPLLIGNVTCFVCAVVINNLIKSRQYPIYW